MKAGVIIIEPYEKDDNRGIIKEEIIGNKRHGAIIKEYCEKNGIPIKIPHLSGMHWAESLVDYQRLIITLEDQSVIYIPTLITDFQYKSYKINVKKYKSRRMSAFSYYEINGEKQKVLIDDPERSTTWELIDEEIEEKYDKYKKLEGEKVLCMKN